MWDNYIPTFSKKIRVITIDLLGHGETECLGYVHTMEDNADAVHSVLLELGIRKSILVAILWVQFWLSPNCTLNM
jgi:pimeloyl-ACP methyl ester carboxylesterase